MPKKRSHSKTTSNLAKKEAKSAEVKKPSVMKPLSEIDEIFASKKRKKVDEQPEKIVKKSRKIKAINGFDVFAESDSTSARKRTAEGLTIYSEEELGLSKSNGGDTPLCPFDCSCCF